MKKLLIIFISFLLLSNVAFADMSEMTCTKPYDVSSKTNQIFSRIFGATFFAEKIAESIIKKQLKKETGEKFKVSLKSFSLNDLKKGIFKSLKITGRNLDLNGIFIDTFEAKTLCDFNYFDFTTDEIYNKSNILMKYNLIVSEKNLQDTIQTQSYLNAIRNLDLKSFGIRLFKINDINILIKDERLYFILSVYSPFVNNPDFKFEISSLVKIEDGKLKVYDVKLENTNKRINIAKYLALLDSIDPLKYSLDIFSIPNGKFLIKNIKIVDDKILVDGIIFIPKK